MVVTFGITYSIFTFNQTGDNSQLVLGDIWMKYTENNQLVLSDAMPMDGTDYIVNPIMKEQKVIENELMNCVGILTGMPLASGTMTEFCKGTGTASNGATFQENIDNGDWFSEDLLLALKENNIVSEEEGGSYTVNSVMSSQNINELSSCVSFYTGRGYEFDVGSTVESFCQGTGTVIWSGYTIQEDLDAWIDDAERNGYDFLEDGGQELLDAGVILSKIENLPYFEFTISGKNTYSKKDIWYEIVLNHGDEHETRTTRIRDDLLKFTLVKVEEDAEEILLNDRTYSSLNNKRIWVETINANTTTEINNKYRLYMWIDENTIIGNINQDYTLEEWDDVFASIKVGVNGDFVEKTAFANELCFTYEMYKIVIPIMLEQDVTDETTELYKCVNYFEENAEKIGAFTRGDFTWEEYCKGTKGRYNSDFTLQEDLNGSYTFSSAVEKELINLGVVVETEEAMLNGYNQGCGVNVVIPKEIDDKPIKGIYARIYNYRYGFTIFDGANIESVVLQDNITVIGEGAFNGLNTLKSVTFSNNLTKIGHYAFYDAGLTNVELPDSLKEIGSQSFRENNLESLYIPSNVETIGGVAFGYNNLASVVFGDNAKLKTIRWSAFSDNRLTSIEIPNSVTMIEDGAFEGNQLKTITIGSGIQYIGRGAIYKNSEINPDLENITFTGKTCEEIKNIEASSTDTKKYFPWLYNYSPYYQEGYKADIIGTDGVCSY